jgi:hypothetical protein
MKRPAGVFFLSLTLGIALLVRCGCDNGVGPSISAGGSGTETIAGNLVGPDGSPLEGAAVTVYEAGASDASLAKAVADTFTDNAGRFAFDTSQIRPGTYSIECDYGNGELKAWIAEIEYVSDSVTLGIIKLKPPGSISGTVTIDEDTMVESHAFIPGTSYDAWTGVDGEFTISGIPEGTFTVFFSHPGYLRASLDSIAVRSGADTALAPVALERDPSLAPPAPDSLSAVFDTLDGIVTLIWPAVSVRDLKGYNVYIDTGGPCPCLLNPLPVNGVTFSDTVYQNAGDTLARTLTYHVRAVDSSATESLPSETVSIDAVPPKMVATVFEWTIEPEPGATLAEGDTVRIIVAFSNPTRSIVGLWWGIDDSAGRTGEKHPDTVTAGEDTLLDEWTEGGEKTVYITVQDASGHLWRDSRMVTFELQLLPRDVWDTLPDMPTARRWLGCASVEGNVYAVGGCVDEFVGYQSQSAVADVEMLDMSTETWKSVAPLNRPRYNFGIAALDSVVYVFGGNGFLEDLSSVERYDPRADTWTECCDLPTVLIGCAACAVEGVVYVSGGIIPDYETGSYTVSRIIYEFDPSANTFTEKAEMASSRAFHRMEAPGASAIILGGMESARAAGPLASAERFDPSSGQTTAAAPMNVPRVHFGAAAVGADLFIAGGSSSRTSSDVLSDTWKLPSGGTAWEHRAALPSPLHCFGICAVQNTIIAAGGSVEGLSPPGVSGKVYRYYP